MASVSSALLVDATSVDPGVLDAGVGSQLACHADLFEPFSRLMAVLLHVAEGDFFLFPGVREDGVFWDVSADEILKAAGGRVDESHVVGDILLLSKRPSPSTLPPRMPKKRILVVGRRLGAKVRPLLGNRARLVADLVHPNSTGTSRPKKAGYTNVPPPTARFAISRSSCPVLRLSSSWSTWTSPSPTCRPIQCSITRPSPGASSGTRLSYTLGGLVPAARLTFVTMYPPRGSRASSSLV